MQQLLDEVRNFALMTKIKNFINKSPEFFWSACNGFQHGVHTWISIDFLYKEELNRLRYSAVRVVYHAEYVFDFIYIYFQYFVSKRSG